MNGMVLSEEFKKRMEQMLQDSYPAFLKAYDEEPRGGLRVNTLKIAKEEFLKYSSFSLCPVPWAANGFYYEKEQRPGKHVWHEMGLYYMQEPSAMAVAEAAKVKPGEAVLDLCAAPGGKSTQLAAALQGEGILIANEIHPARCKILSQNIERMGIGNCVVTNETPDGLSGRFFRAFDCVVVDAPCSGEGMFRKDEEAIRQWSVDNVYMCADRQKEILAEAVKMVRPGGRLVYSTCTFEPAENEEMMQWLLDTYPEFSLQEVLNHHYFTEGSIPKTCRLWPHLLEGEGHFVACLTKNGEEEEGKESFMERFGEKNPSGLKDKSKMAMVEAFIKETFTESFGQQMFLEEEKRRRMVLFGEQLYLLPCNLSLKGCKVLRPGLHLGTFRKSRFEPSHSLALFLKPDAVHNVAEVSLEEAERYVKGETLSKDGEKGWCLVTLDGFSLGFGKRNNGCIKNHYPKGLRK